MRKTATAVKNPLYIYKTYYVHLGAIKISDRLQECVEGKRHNRSMWLFHIQAYNVALHIDLCCSVYRPKVCPVCRPVRLPVFSYRSKRLSCV